MSDVLVLAAYFGALGCLALYGAHRAWMLAGLRRRAPAIELDDRWEPVVTVQLPIYNERTVAARLLHAASGMDWPRDKLEIQVLDDSTDETCEIVEREVSRLRSSGFEVRLLRRQTRTGYKAGALDQGLAAARGELIAIFDADFVPPADFLRRSVPHFAAAGIGMVQARWGHLNRRASWLTRAQATLLDGHFAVEHAVRHAKGLFFNFNGTAGVWRRQAIESAGGWQHDTLTEDLDLSYRAQLAGWRFVYLGDLVAPAEVPPDVSAFKSQQQRWAKGSVQVARKLLPRILRSPQPLRVKVEALAHLTNNAGYPLVLLFAALLPFAAGREARLPTSMHSLLFCLCTASVFLFYDAAERRVGRGRLERAADVVAAVVLGVGMSLSQTRAVIGELYSTRTGEFVRTPKRGELGSANAYRAPRTGVPGLELLFALHLTWGVVRAASAGDWGLIPFLILFGAGFAWVGTLSLTEHLRERAARDAQRSLPDETVLVR